ncbi:hypothetical protein BDF21DRAFT_395651 [Thamnidium elegans]|nr:hypothetical protein BDF21DRAFT_395651 [Thamnidium elegans]
MINNSYTECLGSDSGLPAVTQEDIPFNLLHVNYVTVVVGAYTEIKLRVKSKSNQRESSYVIHELVPSLPKSYNTNSEVLWSIMKKMVELGPCCAGKLQEEFSLLEEDKLMTEDLCKKNKHQKNNQDFPIIGELTDILISDNIVRGRNQSLQIQNLYKLYVFQHLSFDLFARELGLSNLGISKFKPCKEVSIRGIVIDPLKLDISTGKDISGNMQILCEGVKTTVYINDYKLIYDISTLNVIMDVRTRVLLTRLLNLNKETPVRRFMIKDYRNNLENKRKTEDILVSIKKLRKLPENSSEKD